MMTTLRKEGGIIRKTDILRLNLFILEILLPARDVQASIQESCLHATMNWCPFVTLENGMNGETMQYTPKALPSDLSMAEILSGIKLPEGLKHYYCAMPACLSNPCLHGGSCEESETGFLCNCSRNYHGERCESDAPRDCSEIQASGITTSGVYGITPDGDGDPFSVYCDMETDGGGWTVFQRRLDGSVDFYLYWSDYKDGFGNLSAEHWLGNDKIHRLTSQKTYELRVDLEDFERHTRYASYSIFRIADESADYALTISGYSGDAGDSLLIHSDKSFTTRDRDQDMNPTKNCAVEFSGAWWYNECHHTNLNGQYLGGATSEFGRGVTWKSWRGQNYSLKKTAMKIRLV